VFAHEEDMLLLETASRLLRHFSSSKGLSVNELAGGVDGFETGFHLVRNVLNSHEVDL